MGNKVKIDKKILSQIKVGSLLTWNNALESELLVVVKILEKKDNNRLIIEVFEIKPRFGVKCVYSVIEGEPWKLVK
mgnify:FL=1